jgi:hypothetical protein
LQAWENDVSIVPCFHDNIIIDLKILMRHWQGLMWKGYQLSDPNQHRELRTKKISPSNSHHDKIKPQQGQDLFRQPLPPILI